jgi:hypothetical protein
MEFDIELYDLDIDIKTWVEWQECKQIEKQIEESCDDSL